MPIPASQRSCDWPPSAHLGPGELRVEFKDAEDLLRQLLGIAMAIEKDYVRFAERIELRPVNLSGDMPL